MGRRWERVDTCSGVATWACAPSPPLIIPFARVQALLSALGGASDRARTACGDVPVDLPPAPLLQSLPADPSLQWLRQCVEHVDEDVAVGVVREVVAVLPWLHSAVSSAALAYMAAAADSLPCGTAVSCSSRPSPPLLRSHAHAACCGHPQARMLTQCLAFAAVPLVDPPGISALQASAEKWLTFERAWSEKQYDQLFDMLIEFAGVHTAGDGVNTAPHQLNQVAPHPTALRAWCGVE